MRIATQIGRICLLLVESCGSDDVTSPRNQLPTHDEQPSHYLHRSTTTAVRSSFGSSFCCQSTASFRTAAIRSDGELVTRIITSMIGSTPSCSLSGLNASNSPSDKTTTRPPGAMWIGSTCSPMNGSITPTGG